MSWFRSRASKPGDLYCRALRTPWRIPFLWSRSLIGGKVSVVGMGARLPFELARIVDLVGSAWPLRRRCRHREGSPGELRSEAGSSEFGSSHDRSLLSIGRYCPWLTSTSRHATESICAWCYYLQSWTGSGDPGGAERRSFHHHRMVVFGRRWGVPQQQNERN